MTMPLPSCSGADFYATLEWWFCQFQPRLKSRRNLSSFSRGFFTEVYPTEAEVGMTNFVCYRTTLKVIYRHLD